MGHLHKKISLYFVFVVLAITLSFMASANTRHAVVIGVTDYPYLDSSLALIGPGNDAQLVYKFLKSQNFNPKNISLLAENQTSAKSPTRENIFKALEQVVARAERGDFVYLHFAGHGSQQPTTEGLDSDELDGLDEIFLPADAKHWNARIGTVENAITDNEINLYMSRIRTKGAFVWAVFDSCHSGTMTRGNPAVVMRKIDPRHLGIPESALAKARQVESQSRGSNKPPPPFNVIQGNDSLGGYVAFFAAQTNEETPEMYLPRRGKGKKRYGLFTYTMMRVLSSHPGITYQQAAEQILQYYGQHPWSRSTPLFAGTHLNAPVFGTEIGKSQRQWQLESQDGILKIAAGRLHNVTDDSILVLLPSPIATMEDTLGYVSVSEASNLSSLLQPITYAPPKLSESSQSKKILPALRIEDIPKGVFVRLVKTQISLQLTVGIAPNKELNIEQAKVGNSVIAHLRNIGIPSLDIGWVGEKDSSNIRLFNAGDKLLLIADYEELPCPFGPCTLAAKNRKFISVSLKQNPKAIRAQLTSKIRTVAKALNLMQLSSYMGDNGVPSLKSEIKLIRKQTSKSETLTPAMVPILLMGDTLSLNIENVTDLPQDVTVFFVDSGYGISLVYPRGGRSNRFQPGNSKIIKLGTINIDTTGPERLIILSNAATRNSPASNFAFLAQKSIVRTRGIRERGSTDKLKNLFENAGFGPSDVSTSRGLSGGEDTLDSGSMIIFNWTTSESSL